MLLYYYLPVSFFLIISFCEDGSEEQTALLGSPCPQMAHHTVITEQIAQNVREEIRRLKRRKILQCGERSMECEGGYESPASPPSPASLTSPLPSPSSSASAGVASLHPSQQSSLSKDKPLFTFRQVSRDPS